MSGFSRFSRSLSLSLLPFITTVLPWSMDTASLPETPSGNSCHRPHRLLWLVYRTQCVFVFFFPLPFWRLSTIIRLQTIIFFRSLDTLNSSSWSLSLTNNFALKDLRTALFAESTFQFISPISEKDHLYFYYIWPFPRFRSALSIYSKSRSLLCIVVRIFFRFCRIPAPLCVPGVLSLHAYIWLCPHLETQVPSP